MDAAGSAADGLFAVSTGATGEFRGTAACSSRDANGLAPALRQAIRDLDPDLPVQNVMTLAKVVGDQLTGMNYITAMIGTASLLSLLLAAVGIYGLMAFFVAERTREIGIRMALGASSQAVVRMVVSQGFRLIGIGLATGFVCALAVAKLLAGVIFGVRSFDAAALLAGVAALTLAGLAASYIPARWASRVDPATALRR